EPEPVLAAEPVSSSEPERLDLGPLEYGVGLGLGVSDGSLPGAGPALEVSPFFGVRRVHARLVGQYRTPRGAELPGNPEAGASFQLVAVGGRICPNVLPQPHRVRVPLCAGADVGAVLGSARGTGVRNPGSATSFWSAVTLEGGLSVQLTRWLSVTGAFEAGIALSQPKFRLEGGGLLHEAARFAPRGTVGVQFHRARPIP
ncbi:MAG: hypothetical protein KUG77_03170, partial [Nannocystaceae bacterium]|nr:hypothetical protein [Nannocystaceae bacterium]